MKTPPAERFEKWISTHAEKWNEICRDAIRAFGYDQHEIEAKRKEAVFWLRVNKDNKKADKKSWARFWKNWLKPRTWNATDGNTRNRSVSDNFAETSGERKLS